MITASDYDLMRGRPPVSSGAPQGPAPMMNWNTMQPAAPSQRPATFTYPGAYGPSAAGANVGAPDHFFNRLRNVLDNPGSIEGDPAYRFLVDQGSQALSRSAGARRMRFAGKTMQDFQDFGQRAASQYLGQVTGLLREGAQSEAQQYNMRLVDAERNAKAAQDMANREDPYGQARRVASQYSNLDDYLRAWSGFSNSESPAVLRARWMKGRQLLDAMGG